MIVWIASYPKSGNTWIRLLLTAWLRDGLGDLQDLVGRSASSRGLFDRHVGLEASDLTLEEVEGLRGRLWSHLARRSEGPLFVKIHDAFREALVPRPETRAALYVTRNPLDVTVSYAPHLGITPAEAVQRMASPTHCLGLRPEGVDPALPQRVGDWSGHVRSWLDAGLPLVPLRYEDLHRDPRGCLARILEVSGLPGDPERVERAVEACRFDRVRAMEDRSGFSERTTAADRFFRRGQAGAWRDELPEELVRRVVADHGEVMERLGYLP